MAQSSRPGRKRALIVEDEIMVALGLEADLLGLGFDTCTKNQQRHSELYKAALASGRWAFSWL